MIGSTSDDHRLLSETAERYLRTSSPECSDVWPGLVELGLVDLGVLDHSPEAGGNIFVVAEAMGRNLSATPWSSHMAAVIVLASEESPRLGEAGAGRRFVTSVDERLHLRIDDRSRRLCGEARGVIGAPGSAGAVVIAQDEHRGRTAVVVEIAPQAAGYPTLDGRTAADISFDRVPVERESELGGAAAELLLDALAAMTAAEAAGAMRGAVDLTAEHLRTRHQFGAPLATQQALRHRVAEMHVATEQVRAIARHACSLLTSGSDLARRRAASAAKALAGRHGRRVGEDAVQLHGGMGMAAEHLAGRYLRRLVAVDAIGGSTAEHLRRLAAAPEPR